MSSKYNGNFAVKHPQAEPDPGIVKELESRAKDLKISCASAHSAAKALNKSPGEIGKNMDISGFRIVKCQMGIFGYQPEKRLVKPAESVSEELETAIRKSLENNKISCKNCWELADKFKISKMDIANACEALKIKIHSCQLGAF
ncbi:Uncharacterized protein dnl_34810 [Desulfonema limicola]|uniref:Uncharacterized protein n=1 Tax=Desulfonema limicola TaxID=45656 RepID=A0A975GH88_9BACT|nr:hypothetical protein [Desulfonema limicola]QTA81150.1 Uncharacterized protein dnl_34810 [Desulfonema limicola]